MENEIEYPMALSKYLSVCGVASRRKSVELIRNNLVYVNGSVENNPASRVFEKDRVSYEGKYVYSGRKYYIMLNKPRGYICTSDDPYADKKALDLIDIDGPRLFTAGRLDKDSEGLLIVTNDGDYSQKLMHPSHEILKVYRVSVDAPLNSAMISRLCNGINDEGEYLKATAIKKASDKVYLFSMNEGKKREVRRLISCVQRKTIRLQRISVGALSLGELPVGKWRELTEREIAQSLQKNI